jgi:hypothetical protein
MIEGFRSAFDDAKLIDWEVTYVQPAEDPEKSPPKACKVKVKDEDFVETTNGVVLKAHNSGDLLGVVIPSHMLMGVRALLRPAGDQVVPGYN